MMPGDLSQICVVTRNELIKSVRGRKFLISMLIVLVVFGLISLMMVITDSWDTLQSESNVISTYVSNVSMLVLLVVALLSSVSLVSEFEERTALILFTRPVRRTAIFIGKILSCLVIETMIILVYYILVCVVSQTQAGAVSEHMAESFVFCVLYAFAASGIAFIISAFFKKSSVCTIVSLLVLLIVIPVITSMIGGDTWYMLDTAGNCIITCVPEYVDAFNKTLEMFAAVVSNAADVLRGFASPDLQAIAQSLRDVITAGGLSALDPQVIMMISALDQFFLSIPGENLTAMANVLDMMVSSDMLTKLEYPNMLVEGSVLLLWGFVGYLIAWFKFVRREF